MAKRIFTSVVFTSLPGGVIHFHTLRSYRPLSAAQKAEATAWLQQFGSISY